MKDLARAAAIPLILVWLGATATWSLRVARADYLARQETLRATHAALRWAPTQAAYHVRLAVLAEQSDPALALSEWRRAIELDPQDPRAYIDLGLKLERDGQLQEAEQDLLSAAAVDHEYLPKWTLANFYFRRQNAAQFWPWAKAAAEMMYGEGTPLFRLCGEWAEDGNLIERLRIERPEVRAHYLSYLLDYGGPDVASILLPATRAVLDQDRKEDLPLLMRACDRLIEGRQFEAAIDVWNRLAESRRIPLGGVGPQTGSVINGTFSAAPTLHGFDWRMPACAGVSLSMENRSPGLRLTFSGEQRDCTFLLQYVPLRDKTNYQLTIAYRTAGIPADSGLVWRVTDLQTSQLLAEEPVPSSESRQSLTISFRTPANCGIVNLSLQYRHIPDQLRIRGILELRSVISQPQR
ncbi:MAG TPA: tetratricopeptide repeat protein [Bryobacteraceae bacterium]|nr:tetratricopeptide repeat protein [Bryobacteraceae bacterium]